MRKPKVTAKRVLGAVLASSLALAGTVVLAGTSEAAVPAVTLSPASGSAVGGDLLTLKGKGFMDDDNNSLVKAAVFSTAVCADGDAGAVAGVQDATSGLTVTSATKAVLKVPTLTLTAGTWYLCLFDTASGAAGTAIGQAKYTTGDAPTVTALTPASSNVVTASSLGGTSITITGTNFTKKSAVSIDDVAATKTTYSSATKLTAVLPAHVATTGLKVKVSTEYGSVLSSDTVTYTAVVKVSPSTGAASTVNGIELNGKGFNAMSADFVATAADDKYIIAFVPAETTITAGTTTAATFTRVCTNIVVEDDTTLSCKTPNTLVGAYTVRILLIDDISGTLKVKASTGIITAVSRGATYTAASL